MMDEHVTLLDDRFVDGPVGTPEADAAESRLMGATLASVEQYDFRVSPQTPASVMYAEFQRDPLLPGGIVADGETVVGLLSRRGSFSNSAIDLGPPCSWTHRCRRFLRRRLAAIWRWLKG